MTNSVKQALHRLFEGLELFFKNCGSGASGRPGFQQGNSCSRTGISNGETSGGGLSTAYFNLPSEVRDNPAHWMRFMFLKEGGKLKDGLYSYAPPGRGDAGGVVYRGKVKLERGVTKDRDEMYSHLKKKGTDILGSSRAGKDDERCNAN